MRTLPTKAELRDSCVGFWRFTFELLESIDSQPHHLRFAAVNSQIALELFLKYMYVAQGKANLIQKKKKGALSNDFVDFSQVLGHFYSSRKWSYGEKSELVKLMEIRNSIVHRGQETHWDNTLAKSVVRTLFFVHATAWSELGETLLPVSYLPHKISESDVWRQGVESFVEGLTRAHSFEALTCMSCGLKAVVSGDIMVIEEQHTEEQHICLNCLTAIDTSNEARVIECYNCHRESYLIDALNEQEDQMHPARCSECEIDTWVRRCKQCESFYHPSSAGEVEVNAFFFCSEVCSESYSEHL